MLNIEDHKYKPYVMNILENYKEIRKKMGDKLEH